MRVLFFSFLFLFSNAHAQELGSRRASAHSSGWNISPEFIRAHISFLSDDLLEGRAPGTRGDRIAQNYIATQFQLLGLEPHGSNGSYLQSVPIIATKQEIVRPLEVHTRNQSLSFQYLTEYTAVSEWSDSLISVRAALVFVGHGIVAPEYQWDDYKEIDVTGKILLMLNDDPASSDPTFFAGIGRTYYGRWTYKYEIAAQKGALGAIIIHTDKSAGYGWNVVRTGAEGEQFQLASDTFDNRRLALLSWMTHGASERLVSLSGKKLSALIAAAQRPDFRPVHLGLETSIELTQHRRELATNNVIGLLPGNDQELQHEVIVHTAHFDHLGIGSPVDGDSIYNGAMDNAAGIGVMLAVAKAFTSAPQRPRRSILFFACAAEEYGLLGSKYFVNNPTVKLDGIIANFNTDGANIFGTTHDATFLGSEKSTLGLIIENTLHSLGMRLSPDPFPERGSYFRSDHFSFAKAGVPSVSLRSGTDFVEKSNEWAKQMMAQYAKNHYHQPSDTIASWWDFNGAVQQAQIVFQCVLAVANETPRPEWLPNSEFSRNAQGEETR